jgi:formylglycine-generating enzyme required for sulfatase activity
MPEEKHQPRVFISYSRRDLAFVEQLAADLKAAGLDVWYDLSGLQGGSRWSREIEKAIRDSQYVLVVLSPDSVASKWVEEEFLYASELNKKIIPLLYKQCGIPFGYRTLHFIEVRESKYERNFNELLRALDTQPFMLKKPPVSMQEESSPEKSKIVPKPEQKKNNLKLNMRAVAGLFGLATLIIAGIVGIPYMAEIFSKLPKATATATEIPRPFNATEASFISKAAPTQASQTATASVLSTNVTIEDTQAAESQLPNKITDIFGVEMVLVPEGEFIMGSNDEIQTQPVHKVFLDSFYIDRYEVSNGSYLGCEKDGKCMPPLQTNSNTHPSYYGNPEFDKFPVIFVTWDMATSYCKWRFAQLPTEAQWEKAARGEDGRTYPWGEGVDCTRANYYDPYRDELCVGDATAVGSFESDKSPYDVYDMAGNVSEWVADYYSETYYQISPFINPLGPVSGEERVVRGGAWGVNINIARPTFRLGRNPITADEGGGFRCAKNAAP